MSLILNEIMSITKNNKILLYYVTEPCYNENSLLNQLIH